MGAMALLLNVCLRKPGVYALHAGAPSPQPGDTGRALGWSQSAVWWAWAFCALLALAFDGLLHVVSFGA